MSLVLLAACGADAPEQVRETPAPRDSSVFDPLTGTLDRAQGVEDTLRDSAQDRRRQLEEAEGR
ncbi:MAG: hypothetical protein R3305_00945 [Gammaproteobacteria bacterium]|nr:hypothetical protein [Gammaproteobacteria bacterium]